MDVTTPAILEVTLPDGRSYECSVGVDLCEIHILELLLEHKACVGEYDAEALRVFNEMLDTISNFGTVPYGDIRGQNTQWGQGQ